MLKANVPNRKSWIEVASQSDFPIQNIPFGIFKTSDKTICVGSRIGDYAIDLNALLKLNYFDGISLDRDIFNKETLNDFLKLGKPIWRQVRDRIAEIFDSRLCPSSYIQLSTCHMVF